MGRLQTNDPLLKNLHGKVGQLVFKQYGDVTVVTKYPNMKTVKRSEKQKQNSARFKEAVAYARSVPLNPEGHADLVEETKRETSPYYGKTLYQAAIAQFLSKK